MKNLLRYSLILLGAGFVLTACISTSSEPEIVATRLVAEPVTSDPPAQFDQTDGASLFAENCAPCHGDAGLGDGPAASGFSCEMPALALARPEVDLRDWVDTATNGRRSSDTCIMPPWNQRLNSEQIWNAVVYAAGLRHDATLLNRGESLLTDFQTGESVDFLANTDWQADNTDADILTALSANTLDGFDIPDPLSDDDQQAALAYIRALAYAETSSDVAQVSPQTTEEAQPTSAPVATEEAEEPPAATQVAARTEPLTLNGTVINGTTGAEVPNDLELTLRIVGLDESGAPVELYREDTGLADGQSFTFENVPPEERALAAIEANYGGVRQFTPQIIPSAFTEDSVDITFTIYETTRDPENIVLAYTESWIDAVTAEGASLILQSYEFINVGDQIYIGDGDGRTLTIPLPTGTFNAAIDAFANSGDRFQLEQVGDRLIFYDTQPVYPGAAGRIATSFDMPYDGSMQVTQAYAYPVSAASVYVAEARGLELEGEQLTPADNGTLNNNSYRGFDLSLDELPAGTDMSYRVFDGTRSAATTSTTPAANDADDESPLAGNSGLILGIGVLLIIGGGMFLFYDLQKKRLQMESEQMPPTIVDEEDLIAAIAALDDAFEAGNIGEVPYHNRRQALKDALRDRMR